MEHSLPVFETILLGFGLVTLFGAGITSIIIEHRDKRRAMRMAQRMNAERKLSISDRQARNEALLAGLTPERSVSERYSTEW